MYNIWGLTFYLAYIALVVTTATLMTSTFAAEQIHLYDNIALTAGNSFREGVTTEGAFWDWVGANLVNLLWPEGGDPSLKMLNRPGTFR